MKNNPGHIRPPSTFPKWFLTLINVLCCLLSVPLAAVLYLIVGKAMLIILAMMLFLLYVPLIMKKGTEIIISAKESADAHISRGEPVVLNKKRIFFGYFLMFIFPWMFYSASLMLPEAFIIYITPVLFVYLSVIVILTSRTWSSFRLPMAIYWIVHTGIIAVISSAAIIIRINVLGY